MRLHTRLFLITGAVMVTIFGVIHYSDYRQIHDHTRQDMLDKAELIRNLLMSTRRVYHHAFLESGVELTPKTIGLLPAHALSEISGEFAEWDRSGISFNNVSDRPRNPEQKADVLDHEAIDWFRQNPKSEQRVLYYHNADGTPFIHYARPIWIEPYCLNCHGEKEQADPTVRELYDTAYDYRVGELRGILSIKIPASTMETRASELVLRDLLFSVGALSAMLLLLWLALRREVSRPLRRLTEGMEAVAKGEERPLPPLPGEFGAIGEHFNAMASTVRRRELQLSESEAWIRSLLDTVGEGIYAVDTEGRCVMVNHTAARMLGHDEARLIGADMHPLIHHHHADGREYPKEECLTHRVLHERRTVQGDDETYWRADGTPFPVEYRSIPLITKGGDVEGAVVSFQDITQRKQAELALRREKETAQEYLDIVGSFIVALDADARVTLINRRGAELAGAPEYQIVGKDWFTHFVPGEDEAAARGAFHQLMAGEIKPVRRFENRVRSLLGEERIILWNNTVLRDAEGRIVGTLSAGEDVTEIRRVEEGLREAKETAETANRAKDEFLAVVSHELRTPLNAILGMGELVGDGPLSDEQREYLTIQSRAAEGLTGLVESLIDLTQIQSGRLSITRTPFEPRELLEAVAKVVEAEAARKGLELRIHCADALPRQLEGDRFRLYQILANLAGNAVKFTHRGFVRIAIEPDARRPMTVRFEVSDSGIGIEPEAAERIFEPFTQGDTSMTRRYGGSGLGLTIARRLSDAMEGELAFESPPGEGSRFHLTLAMNAASEAVGEATPSPATEAETEGLEILLAEDSPDNTQLILAYLKNTPHRVTAVENGEQALEVFDGGNIDIILMDIQMPVMDGHQAVRLIRERERTRRLPRTPIVALTAHAYQSDYEKSIEAGCDAHLTKPIKQTKLREVIFEYAKRR